MRKAPMFLAVSLLCSLAYFQAAPRPRNVAILVYEGVELLDFAGPGEVFSAAHGSDGRGFRVYTVAKSAAPITSQGFVRVTPQFTLEECPRPDLVVIPGGAVPDEDQELLTWVRGLAGSAELVMSVCNGAALLARAGLLDGHEATTHHGSLEFLTREFPRVRVLTNRRFVDAGRVMTCAGVSAGIDGALHVVERLHGAESARATARYMEYDWRPEEIARLHAEPARGVSDGPLFQLAKEAREQGVAAALASLRALARAPEEAEFGEAARLLLGRGSLPEARALLELAVAAFPSSPLAYDGLSEALERLGDAPAALRAAEAALDRLPGGLSEARVAALRNAASSRQVRLGQGEASSLRYVCAPCGGDCDRVRYLTAGNCPGCGMVLVLASE